MLSSIHDGAKSLMAVWILTSYGPYAMGLPEIDVVGLYGSKEEAEQALYSLVLKRGPVGGDDDTTNYELVTQPVDATASETGILFQITKRMIDPDKFWHS